MKLVIPSQDEDNCCRCGAAFVPMTSENNREYELVSRIARGDRRAMREFYDDYSGYLTAVCLRYVASRDDVKDVLQESFIKIFGSIGRFEYRGAGALRAWAGRIVVNESLKHLEHRRRLRAEEATDEQIDADTIERDHPDLGAIPRTVILEMIRSLPEGYRTVFNLYVFEGMSHGQISSTLGIAEDTSASQLFRARNALAKKIKKYASEKGDGNE